MVRHLVHETGNHLLVGFEIGHGEMVSLAASFENAKMAGWQAAPWCRFLRMRSDALAVVVVRRVLTVKCLSIMDPRMRRPAVSKCRHNLAPRRPTWSGYGSAASGTTARWAAASTPSVLRRWSGLRGARRCGGSHQGVFAVLPLESGPVERGGNSSAVTVRHESFAG
jgi:hypothetical protein